MTTIEFKNVSFGYKHDSLVLRNVNLTIDKPGYYCIIGPNGVGKSTIVKLISKINNVTSGEVLLNGINVKTMRFSDIAKIVGYVPAFSNDLFSMDVIDTIMVGRYNHNKAGSDEINLKVVYKTMKMLQIEDLGMRRFNELSAGQHQKVAIARGLVQEPEILILDEPTANLDVKYQVYVNEILRAIAEKLNIIILTISHDLNASAKYAHEVIMLAPPGVIHAMGTPEEVITEENIRTVYDVNCKVIPDPDFGSPHVILGMSRTIKEE